MARRVGKFEEVKEGSLFQMGTDEFKKIRPTYHTTKRYNRDYREKVNAESLKNSTYKIWVGRERIVQW